MPLNFFNEARYLEPRCPKCRTVLNFGVNTYFDEKNGRHICRKCNEVLKGLYEEHEPVLKVVDFDVE